MVLIILFYKYSFLRQFFNISSYNYDEFLAQHVKLNCFQHKIWNLNALLFFTLVKIHGRIFLYINSDKENDVWNLYPAC